MPPKNKKSAAPVIKKKSKVSRRQSLTKVNNGENGPPRTRRPMERSVVTSIDEESTCNDAAAAVKRSAPQPAPPTQAPNNARPKEGAAKATVPATPSTPLPTPGGAAPAPQQQPISPQGAQQPPAACPASGPATPAARPTGFVSSSAYCTNAQLTVPCTAQGGTAQQPAPPLCPTDTLVKKNSREKDDGSVDGNDTSVKKKKTDAINNWIRTMLQNGVEGLRKEYRESPNETPPDKTTVFLDNPTRNRYHNIPCCDTSRVRIADDPYFYIHANLVSSGPNPRRFICTQAPLNGTIEDFWKMIIVSGVEYIVMLCELVEKGKQKSAEYFPLKLGDTMKIGRLCTVTKESCVDIDKTLSMSTMRISKPDDVAVAKIVKHIHWHNWPDHGVPDNFLSPFRLLTVVKSCTKPVVVHCSAGVGRTGTLVLILIILESLLLPEFLGVPHLLAKLREERFRSIQTELQYIYVHRCVLEYLVLKKYTYSREDYAKFAKDYEQALANCCKNE